MGSELQTAIRFVIDRISEEAEREGVPLNDEDHDFLLHLPTEPTSPSEHQGHYPALSGPTPRDLRFERLCTLAKNARLYDTRVRLEATEEWKRAAAVLQLNRHPMSWLLLWSGAKRLRPRWDRLLLVATAATVVGLAILGAIALSALAERFNEVWTRPLWIAGGCIYAVIVIFLYIAAQRREKKELDRIVHKGKDRLPEAR